MAHLYDVGTRAWQPDQTEGWVASEVEEKTVDGNKVKLVFRLASGEVRAFFIGGLRGPNNKQTNR
jgi:myosin V